MGRKNGRSADFFRKAVTFRALQTTLSLNDTFVSNVGEKT